MRNKVQLIGNLGTNPEVITTASGKKMVKLFIATNEYYRNEKGERESKTQWHNVVVWGKTAKIAEDFLQKGKEVAIEGRLNHRTYEDKDGKTVYVTDIVANELVLLGSKS